MLVHKAAKVKPVLLKQCFIITSIKMAQRKFPQNMTYK